MTDPDDLKAREHIAQTAYYAEKRADYGDAWSERWEEESASYQATYYAIADAILEKNLFPARMTKLQQALSERDAIIAAVKTLVESAEEDRRVIQDAKPFARIAYANVEVEDLQEILSAAPGAALRQVRAQAFDEGAIAHDNASSIFLRDTLDANPYRVVDPNA